MVTSELSPFCTLINASLSAINFIEIYKPGISKIYSSEFTDDCTISKSLLSILIYITPFIFLKIIVYKFAVTV